MKVARIIVAAILGGAAMFAWGAASHMVLQIGDLGMQGLPSETEILPAMKATIHERGFYVFPGFPEGELTDAQEEEWMDKYRAGPRGVLVYDPTGAEMMTPGQLGAEYASNALAALLAAIVLANVPGSRGKRMLFGLLFGLVGWLSIDVSYWNWYGFPDLFATAQLIDQGVGWLLSGVVIALVLGRSQPAVTRDRGAYAPAA
jgi:hypothetical protein